MSISARDALNFPKLARDAFQFVTEPPFGMTLVGEDRLELRYEGKGVGLIVFHDRLSYELGIAVWRLSEPREAERPYSLSDLMRVSDPAAAQRYRRFAATTAEALQHGLMQLAAHVYAYGRKALLNDADFYRQAAEVRQEAIRRFGQDMQERSARSRAESAWQQRDWHRVAEAYGDIERGLSPAERERLTYARRALENKQ